MLPASNGRIRRSAVFHEEQLSLGFSTRRISSSARVTFGTVHSVHVATPVSLLWSSSGIASASRSSVGGSSERIASFAIESSFGDGSRPMTREMSEV
jgi:hypothetical protein